MINQLDSELVEISRQLSSLTVEIANRNGGGSGFIWSADGLIVTNAHVIKSSEVKVRLEDETIFEGLVITRDDSKDLAAIEIQAKNLPTPTIRNTSDLRPGEIVFAMGSPWGFRGALTVGTLHAIHDREYPPVIVADIRLAPGNSGGILADAEGRVIGINTAIVNGLALAIPCQQIQNFVQNNVR